MPEERESPRGRAVGDEDATSGPMDDLPPGLADGADRAAVDTASIEEDRARSSGRPPLASVPPVPSRSDESRACLDVRTASAPASARPAR